MATLSNRAVSSRVLLAGTVLAGLLTDPPLC